MLINFMQNVYKVNIEGLYISLLLHCHDTHTFIANYCSTPV